MQYFKADTLTSQVIVLTLAANRVMLLLQCQGLDDGHLLRVISAEAGNVCPNFGVCAVRGLNFLGPCWCMAVQSERLLASLRAAFNFAARGQPERRCFDYVEKDEKIKKGILDLFCLCAGAEQLHSVLREPPDLLSGVCAALHAPPGAQVQPRARQAPIPAHSLLMGALVFKLNLISQLRPRYMSFWGIVQLVR